MKLAILGSGADKPTTAEMYFFGTIGEDIKCGDFIQELNELSANNDTVVVHINSGGGSIFDGLTIYNAIMNCKAEIVGKIDGLCASMATVVALGMDKLYMCKSAQFMTHKASGIAAGSAEDLKTYASMMDHLEKVICEVYAGRTGLPSDEVRTQFLQPQDRWFSANEALAAKLIDGIYDNDGQPVQVPANVKGQKELISFYNSHLKTFTRNMKQLTLSAGQLASLGLKPESDPAAYTAAIDGLIMKAARVDKLEGDVTKLTNELLEEKGKTVTAKIEAMLEKALNTDKKITAAAAASLKADYKDNPDGLEKLLNSLPKIVSVTDNLKEGTESEEFKGTWPELDKAGKLAALKEKNFPLFKEKYKAQFGKDWTGQ